ncbi:hypothetical protein ACF0H5_017407 [Mactra antiquata]
MSKKNVPISSVYKKKKNQTTFGKSSSKAKDVKPSTSDYIDPVEENDIKILRDFDLNWEYGPSMGITRMERWNRAAKHGLNPSDEVKQLIDSHPDDEKYTKCLWNDYKNIM